MKNSTSFRRGAFGLAAASLVAASLFSTSGNAITRDDDVTETRDVETFTKIIVKGAVEIDVTAGKRQSVEVNTDEDFIDKVETYVKNGTLYIDMSEKQRRGFWNNVEIDIKINVENLEGIEVRGAIDGEFHDINADNFDIEIKGAADFEIDGKCGSLNLDVKGAGDIDARDFKCENVEVDVRGAGSASVYAKKEINADVSGVGSISVYGSPENVRKRVGGIGSIDIK